MQMKTLRVLSIFVITLALSLSNINAPVNVNAGAVGCASSGPSSGKYTINICITSPANGASLTGNAAVTVTATITSGSSSNPQQMIFYLSSSYLLTSYSAPYTFTLPTAKWADGSYTLNVHALMPDGFITATATIALTFNNGNATAPVNTNQFTPSSGIPAASGQPFVVAAAGDGASGQPTSTKVINTISSLNPNLFLYLGDVYESGSVSEFYNWYGNNSSNFSVLRAITDPTIGNHEYTNGVNGAGYFDYWNNIPNYYSFNAGGWHFISLNSNSSKIGVTTSSAQYKWLQQDLAANAGICTIAYYHEPLFNIGAEGDLTAMSSIWALLASYGVSMVLNGHDHDYQRWVPLDANGQPSSTGVTEFVAGGGGHGLQTFTTTDTRVAYSNDLNPTAFGVLLLQLGSSGANFSYHNSNGSILDSGFVPCNPSVPPTGTPPTTATVTPTMTPTITSTPTPTITLVATNTSTPTATLAASTTPTPAPTLTFTPTDTPVASYTPTNTDAPTFTPSFTFTPTDSPIASNTPTNTDPPTFTPTFTFSPTDTLVATNTPTPTFTPTATTGTSSVTFNPVADAYVNSASPSSNFGTNVSLRVDANTASIMRSYLRFTVSGLGSATVQSAMLRIYANSANTAGFSALALSDNTWGETTITYSNAPTPGNTIKSSAGFGAGSWVQVDISSYINAQGTYNLVLTTTSTTNTNLASRELGADAPQLIISYH